MAEIRAFAGLRYDERVAGPLSELLCPPYDVISPEERARLAARSPRNFVHVELPEPTHAGYTHAATLLREWRDRGAFVADGPSVYVHEHEFSLGGVRATRHGVFVALRLYAPEEGAVLPHERTFPKAKADRLELLRATRTNTSPVFGMVAGRAMRALERVAASPAGEATLAGDAHRLRRVDAATAARFLDALRDERVYIADGHHRYETALAYAEERRAPRDSAERFALAYLCALDDPGLRILGTHRVISGGDKALELALRAFDAATIDRGALGDVQPGIVLVRDGRFLRLEPRPDADLSALPEVWRRLPVAIAEELLIRPAREAGAEVAYEHDTDRAIDLAAGGDAAVLIRAVDPETLGAVADAGERLPQKTTYFYPKVPSGLVVRTLDI